MAWSRMPPKLNCRRSDRQTRAVYKGPSSGPNPSWDTGCTPALLQVELDRQLRATGRGRPIRRSVWAVVSRTGCCNSHRGLIERGYSGRVDDRRVLFEFSRFIDADMHSHVVRVATGVIRFRIRRCLRRRSRNRFRCSTCPTEGNLLPRVDRIAAAERSRSCESKSGDAADRRGIQSIRTRRRPDGDV